MAARDQVAAWFREAVRELDPGQRLAAKLADGASLAAHRAIAVVAFGKAAGAMAAAWAKSADRRGANLRATRLLISTSVPLADLQAPFPVEAFVGGHPEPNAESLRAGAAMLAAARALGRGPRPALLVALISGGGSAMAEVPLQGSLEDLRARNRRLVASGAPIGEMNLVRKHRSAFKGGRLAAAAGAGVEQESWILSDVAGDDPSAVASGPTLPDGSTREAYEAARARWLPGDAPAAVAEPLKPGDPAFAHARWQVLATNADVCAAVAARARTAGYGPVLVDAAVDEAEVEHAADYLAARWRTLHALHPQPALIAGGEVRVRLPQAHGRGGRNTWLALALALALEGEEFTFLSAGTDGVDGSSDAAGAIVDGGTAARVRAAGMDPAACLRGFDPHPALEAAGDLLRTGPTGNNLRDLRILL